MLFVVLCVRVCVWLLLLCVVLRVVMCALLDVMCFEIARVA